MKKNKKLSQEFGLRIYNSNNKQNPYYVQEWDECYTYAEIKALADRSRPTRSARFRNNIPAYC